MRPSDGRVFALTGELAGLPARNAGNPAWHPDGDWIVFQAEKAVHAGGSRWSEPGLGRHNDLWAVRADGTGLRRLTHLPAGRALLHAHFDPSGRRLLWGQTLAGSDDWAIALAEFVVHYHTDWAKDKLQKRAGYTPQQKGYWVLVGLDQFFHQTTYVVILAVLVAAL